MSEIFSSVLVLSTRFERLAVLERQVQEVLSHTPPLLEPDTVQYNVHLAIHELCVNIITHAYGGEPGKFMLTLSLFDDPWRIEISTCDNGCRCFDASRWMLPRLDNPPMHRLGIFLMHSLMDEVRYTPAMDCSRWRLIKRLVLAGDAARDSCRLEAKPTFQPTPAPDQPQDDQPDNQRPQHQRDVHQG